MEKNVIITDAYGPVERLANKFRAAGYGCVRVQSTTHVPRVYGSFTPSDAYIDNIVHDGNWARTLEAIAPYAPTAVVPGGEVGIEFADQLSESLGVPSNGTALSKARRDKFTMIETIKSAGLRGARQLLVTDEEELTAWHKAMDGRIVIKPLMSAGGDDISFCETPDESVRAYRAIVGTQNIFSMPNSAAVAQEYLPGTEYMINTVSRDGCHHICDVWRSTRLCANGMIDLCTALSLVPADSAVMNELAEYTYKVLDALGIRHGPGHVEIKLTPDGPCLVEAGARMSGAEIPYYAEVGTGHSQLDWTVTAYIRPDQFHADYKEDYRIRRHCSLVAMISPAEGILQEYRGIESIERLESFFKLHVLVRPGERITRTVDDLTYPVLVALAHEIEECVLRDMATVHYLDGAHFYRTQPTGGAGSARCAW